jgi:hypothetical protein
MLGSKNQAMKTSTLLRLLFAPAAPQSRLAGGRCACHEITVRWCTRHGQPLKNARRRVDELALT